jgi:hypothetical protein
MAIYCYYQYQLKLGLIMKYPFTQAVHDKGWKMQDLAHYWGITPRQMSNIARNPTQLHIDAVRGLPQFEDKYLTFRIDVA